VDVPYLARRHWESIHQQHSGEVVVRSFFMTLARLLNNCLRDRT
jgi:hypothetical protein